ncbi:uncharacterized protein P174DRAFT_465376 [Aspergillus novofumigatus IBT 16806]|uniref:Uncharacterized protein n=1 Tax=Aspergillus novofumigatus (strain IBT 16806) TaxID=1392255 RepID=A0A2I1CJT1_ASPN1|nr:uncharacterized protein P174DRAFT_465376 [Aspergillus novofumigatus IBT 16806]PKX97875.1 hypothetical protein P174DRAFT_465376 [Aspergillus novofumigatus IBT 16806]
MQWIDEQSRMKQLWAFRDCLGIWRPDFILTGDGSGAVGFQLCGINSPESSLKPAGDFNEMVDSLVCLFDARLPIHLVRGRDTIDRQEFIHLVEKKTGLRPRFVGLADLQLGPDPSSATGKSLCCKSPASREEGEELEKVKQVALLLFPDEYSLLAQDLLQHLAPIAAHDFRTSLLANGDRFLGIVLQEIEHLVITHKALTPDQARLLKDCIVPTILPGSLELEQWIDLSTRAEVTKNDYILKAARQSRGMGHLLGEEVSEEKWKVIMARMDDPGMRTGTTCFVLQPYIQQPTFDIVVNDDKVEHGFHMIGTYYTANGRFLGLGPWRAGRAKICNVHGSGCVGLYSVTQADTD